MDCLVLTTESSAMHEIIQDYGITFNAKDPKDIAQKISMIYSPVFDSSLYRQSKDRILQKYTWEKTSSTLYMEFQKLR